MTLSSTTRRIRNAARGAIVFATMLTGACAPPQMPIIQGPEEGPFIPKVQIQESQFEPKVTFVSPMVLFDGQWLRRYSPSYFVLRSWVEKSSGVAEHQIYVEDYYRGDWRFWERANDDDANVMEFTEIGREVNSCSAYGACSHTETFGLDLQDTLARGRAKASGLSVKAYARDGSTMILHVPASVLALQLKAIDDWNSARGMR